MRVPKRLVCLAVDQCIGQRRDLLVCDESEHGKHVLLGNLVATKCDELVERALGVAQSAFRAAGNGGQCVLVDRDFFLFGDFLEVLDDQVGGNPAQIKPLAPREDGGQNFLRFGGGEQEFHMRGWFFERLEQGVERFLGEHVDFVDDVNFEFGARGGVADGVAQLAYFIDAAVAGAVDFQHVQRAALGDFLAVVALVAGGDGGAFDAIQGLGENAGGGRLADAARADKKVGMGEAFLLDGVFQGRGDVLLSHDLIELLRPPFAGKDLILLLLRHRYYQKGFRTLRSLAFQEKTVVHPVSTNDAGSRAAVEAPVRRPDGT